jgi:hypothetical protein
LRLGLIPPKEIRREAVTEKRERLARETRLAREAEEAGKPPRELQQRWLQDALPEPGVGQAARGWRLRMRRSHLRAGMISVSKRRWPKKPKGRPFTAERMT